MTKLRRAAQGKPCLGRFPGICNFDESTTVLAHLRRGGIAGTGYKGAGDLASIRLCSSCHDALDRRTGLEAVPDKYILDALCRTLDAVVREGLVKC